MGLGLNISQPATSQLNEALKFSFTSPITQQIESGNFNFGEIIKPYIQGSPENGGYDVQVPSRLAVTPASSLSDTNAYGSMYAEKNLFQKYPYVFVGGAAALAVIYFKFMR